MALVQDKAVGEFTAADLRSRARGVLATPEQRLAYAEGTFPGRNDFELNPELKNLGEVERKQPAAVLIPIIERGGMASIVFTQRSEHLPSHAGQISFPGGKKDMRDANLVETALREAREEIGLDGEFVETVGFLDDYITSTGYRISPLVAIIADGYSIAPDRSEVTDIFDVPLSHLMNADNYETHARKWRGVNRVFYAIPYEDRFIWGATAGMLRNLYDWLYSSERSTTTSFGKRS